MTFKVPFVNYSLQYKNLEKEIDSAIKDVLSRGDLILREDVERFEKGLASFLGAKYAVGVNSGTDALIFSLKAAGVGPGDEVITVSHTFAASITCVFHVGATPVLIEVKEDFTMDPKEVEKAVTSKTKAILPVHYNGRTCDMEKIMDIAKKHNLAVIEDSAQSLGAKFNNKNAGTFGSASCYSFYPAKILGSAGDAGAVITDDENIAQKIRLYRNHCQRKNAEGKVEFLCFGETSRLHNLQAAILNVKLKYVSSWIERRRGIAKIYQNRLASVKGIKLPPAPDSDSKYFDVFQNYVLQAEKRDELSSFLKENGVETLIKDPIANHLQPAFNLSHFKLSFSEKLADKVISLPMYPELNNEQVEYAAQKVCDFYKQ
ncbi:MAG: DegT/DnrJ/EryC1/StrS family aminotransferase [Candidatus Pacebacteria bacterium]|nr:DegT/DnrJ/EryC1/StrS family aminotransferase [Candidatus Paceibacterota bacterium]